MLRDQLAAIHTWTQQGDLPLMPTCVCHLLRQLLLLQRLIAGLCV
jgi:hypothetical protein